MLAAPFQGFRAPTFWRLRVELMVGGSRFWVVWGFGV